MDKQQVLRDYLGANLPLVFKFANRYAKPFRRTEPDYINEIASLAVIRILECAENWDPSRCAPGTFIVWQIRAIISRLVFYRLKKMAPCRTANFAEVDFGVIEKKPDESIQGPEATERQEFLGMLRKTFDDALDGLSDTQAAAVRAVVGKGATRRDWARRTQTCKNAVDQKIRRGLAGLRENPKVKKLAEYLK